MPRGRLVDRRCEVQDVLALEIAGRPHPEARAGERRIGPRGRVEGLGRPGVEAPLLALAVGIEGAEEGAARRAKLAQQEAGGLERHRPGARVGRARRGLGVGPQEQRVVVEHLLEVRHAPDRIDAVAGEAAAELVVDAAGGHRLERSDGHRAQLLVALSQQEAERPVGRELGGTAEARVLRIEGRAEGPAGALERRRGGGAVVGRPVRVRGTAPLDRPLHRLDRPGGALGRRLDLLASVRPGVCERRQDGAEGGLPVPSRLREVRAAEERTPVGRQHHRHGPAPVAGHRLHRGHVDRVDVGALLAVDLDAHEVAVHLLGGRRVFEGLVRHHVAPVAGRVADRQQDRFVFAPGALERRLAPRQPRDRVGGVLAQVGAGLAAELVARRIGHRGHAGTLAEPRERHRTPPPRSSEGMARRCDCGGGGWLWSDPRWGRGRARGDRGNRVGEGGPRASTG